MKNEDFMHEAIHAAVDNVHNGGGPFGAVIVKDGEIIARGVNRVTVNNDPTAHAEVMAIRAACQKLQTFDLSGMVIYSSCEPCPMCLGAIYWSHIDKLYYAGSQKDAAQAGFDDKFIYEEFDRPIASRRLHTEQILAEEGKAPFAEWDKNADKVEY